MVIIDCDAYGPENFRGALSQLRHNHPYPWRQRALCLSQDMQIERRNIEVRQYANQPTFYERVDASWFFHHANTHA